MHFYCRFGTDSDVLCYKHNGEYHISIFPMKDGVVTHRTAQTAGTAAAIMISLRDRGVKFPDNVMDALAVEHYAQKVVENVERKAAPAIMMWLVAMVLTGAAGVALIVRLVG